MPQKRAYRPASLQWRATTCRAVHLLQIPLNHAGILIHALTAKLMAGYVGVAHSITNMLYRFLGTWKILFVAISKWYISHRLCCPRQLAPWTEGPFEHCFEPLLVECRNRGESLSCPFLAEGPFVH
jgi:hypothetical protein